MSLVDFILNNPTIHVSAKKSEINKSSDDLLFKFGVEFPFSLKLFFSTQNGISLPGAEFFSHQQVYDMTMEDRSINDVGDDKKILLAIGGDFKAVYNYISQTFDLEYFDVDAELSYDTFGELFDYLSDYYNWNSIKEDVDYDTLINNETDKFLSGIVSNDYLNSSFPQDETPVFEE